MRSAEDLYRIDSSATYLNNVSVPVVFINAKDDPIVHTDLLTIPENFASKYYTDNLNHHYLSSIN